MKKGLFFYALTDFEELNKKSSLHKT